MCLSGSWWRLSGGRYFPQASCFHTELVPADRVWSPPHATLDNQKGNILEPFPLSYCVCGRLLLIWSLIFLGGLLCYLNKAHGTCVFFFCNWDQNRFRSPAAFPGSPRCFLWLCGAVRGSFFSRGMKHPGLVLPPSCPSHGEPHPDHFSFSSGLKKKKRKKKACFYTSPFLSH